jgi:aryl-alcohol dehydrogenase-like predicted oxidoreductase
MEYRILGRSGLKVSPLCLGTDNFANPTPEDECAAMIEAGLDAGLNFIDTSNSYVDGECERIIGRALGKNKRRHQVIIATKVFYPTGPGPNDKGGSRRHILQACEDSLRRLQTDYIDLYQIHRHSPDIPIDETLGALTDLVRQGKVRYIGCSTHPAWAVMEAVMVSELKGYARYVSEQPPYNLLDRRIENELIPLCERHGIGIITWAPMAMGVLAGRYNDPEKYPPGSRAALRGGFYADRVTERGIEVAREFAEIAGKVGCTPAQLSVLWCKDQPGIAAPLIGPRTMAHLESLLPVAGLTLDDESRAACDALVPPGSVVANFHNTADWMKMKLL